MNSALQFLNRFTLSNAGNAKVVAPDDLSGDVEAGLIHEMGEGGRL